jgi:2-oxoglutarate/2-oxoacid ferredoxin oxidoreductase subunit beta
MERGRPDQQQIWKGLVRDASVPEPDDAGRAPRRLMTDDGFNLGVLYRGRPPPYTPAMRGNLPVARLKEEFMV